MADPTPEAITQPAPAAASVLDAIKARRAQAEARKLLTLPLPGWGGGLCARYKVIDPKTSTKARSALGQLDDSLDSLESQIAVLAEMLAASCTGLYGRSEDGELTPLQDAIDDDIPLPVRYDQRLADAIGLNPDKQAEAAVVRAVFSNDEGDLNLIAFHAHVEKVLGWMSDTSRPVEDEILGES